MKKLLSLLMLLCLTLTVAPAALAEEVVNVYNWEDYIAPEVLTLFTEETGIKVNYMCFTTNEDMIVQVEANPGAFDVCFPSDYIIERMIAENIDVALTCDAGTPAISDPGNRLVDAAWRAGIRVVPVCGPSATVTALSASGFDAREFAFYGFLPREKKPLIEKLEAIRAGGVPIAVVYESPHRVVNLIEVIDRTLPGCNLAVCCDLTKLYEAIYRGTSAEVLEKMRANPNVEKGEYCLVIDLSPLPPLEKKSEALPADVVMLRAILDGADLDEAANAAREAGCPRNDIYRARLKIQSLFEE